MSSLAELGVVDAVDGIALGYSALSLNGSQRRRIAAEYIERVRDERFLAEIEIANIGWKGDRGPRCAPPSAADRLA